MKTAILIIISSLFLLNCNKDKNKKCSDVLDESEYNALPYNDNQMLVFKSNSGAYDTIYCDQSYIASSYYGSDYDCKPGPSAEYFQLEFFLITKAHLEPIEIIMGSAYYYTSGVTQNNITINGTIYNDVYVLAKDSASTPVGSPWRIYYTIPNGLLRYDYVNYLRWEKIN